MGRTVTDPVTRLREARKQIRIVAEGVHDEDILGELRDADALVEAAAGDLEDRPDDAGDDADGRTRYR